MSNKQALKAILYEISTPQEREGFSAFEKDAMGPKLDSLQERLDEAIESSATKEQTQELNLALRKLKGEFASFIGQLSASLQAQNTALLKGVADLGKVFKEVKPQDNSGFFKDFPSLLADIGGNTKNTSELIRNLKWNASQQLRDVNGSPINPAIAGFGITATYDDVVLAYTGSNLTTVTYKQNGNVKAVLTLSYDGSDNLTEVVRTT